MKKKALKKDFRTEIRKSLNRFLSIFFIVAMGVSFYSGIQASAPDMRKTGDAYFDDSNLMDIRVISTLGLTEGDLKALEEVEGVSYVTGSYMEDVYCGEGDQREVLHVESIPEDMNTLTAEKGTLPTKAGECFLDSLYAEKMGYEPGDTLELEVESEDDTILKRTRFVISGYGNSPCYISFERGSTTLGTGSLSGFVYITEADFDSEVYGVAYLKVEGASEETEFTDAYDEKVAAVYDRVDEISDGRCEIRYREVQEEAQEKIDDAKQEVEDGKQELADAKQELEDGKAEAESELAEAESELIQGESELADGKQEVEDARKEVADGEQEMADGEQEISDNEQKLADARSQIADARNQLASGEAEYRSGLKEYQSSLPAARKKLSDAQSEIDSGKEQLEKGWEEYNSSLATIEEGERQLTEAEKKLKEGQSSYDAAYDGTKAQLDAGMASYEAGVKQVQEGRAAYEAGVKVLEEKQQEYETGKAQLDAAWAQYNSGKQQLEESQAAFDTAEKQVQQLQNSYDAAGLQVASLEKETGELQQAVDTLPGQISGKESEIETLEGQKTAAVSARDEAQKNSDSCSSQIAEKQNQIDKNNGTIQAQEAILNDESKTTEEKQAAQQKIKELQEENQQLASERDALAETKKSYDDEVAGQNTIIDDCSGRISRLTQEISDSRTALENAQNLLPQKKEALETAKKSRDELETQLKPAKEELEGKRTYLEEQKTQLEATRKTLEAKDTELAAGKTAIDQGKSELSAKKQELDQAEAVLAGTKQQLDAGYAQLQAAGDELASGWAELNAKKAELNAGRSQLESAKKELEENEKKLESGQKEIDQGYSQLASAKTQLNSARKKLDLGWAELNASQDQIADGERQLSDARTQLSDAREELADARKQIADAEKEIEENEQKLKDGWEEYEDGKREAEQEIADGEQKIKDAEKELLDAEQKIADAEEKLADIKYPKWYVDDRSALPEHSGFGENADRMSNLAQVFPILFFLVAALISLTTMTRMVEEERTQIGTLKALGYSKASIASKYIKYALYATVGGSVFGFLIGEKIFPWIIINAYGILYLHIPEILVPYNWEYGVMALGFALICTLGATVSACYRELKAVPAQLMRPPSPKNGKRVLLEHIPFLWRSLSFTWKSTVRNLMRYKKRFLMTVIGIGGCMGLLLVGYGLRDSIMDVGIKQFNELQLFDAIVVFDTDAGEDKQQEALQSVEEEERISEWKRFLMQKEDVQRSEGGSGKVWSVYLYVPESTDDLEDFFCFRDRQTQETYTLTDEGAIITEKLAKQYEIEPGDSIVLKQEDGDAVEIPVSYVCENYLHHYIYITPALYEKVFGEAPEYNSVFIRTEEDQETLEEIGGTLLAEDTVLNITYTESLISQIDNMLGALDIVIVVLIVSAGMLAFVVLYNLNNININERKRELATLKVLGFFNGEVASYVYRENILLTLIGALLGIFIGKLLHAFIITTVEVDTCMFGRDISIQSFVYGTLFTIGFSVIVNFVMYFKLKKIDMVESLKSIE